MKLSLTERLILANQYTILEHLDPSSAKTHANARKVLERAYEGHYGALVEWFEKEPFSKQETDWVFDVLDMHRALKSSFDHLQDKSGIDPADTRFKGFDGNNEGRYLAYVRYLIEDEERWTDLSSADLNSHAPMQKFYNAMRTEWAKSKDKHDLSKDEIRRIITAWQKA